MRAEFAYAHELQPAMLFALHQISEQRVEEVAAERLERLRDAGFVSRTGQGWRITAAGAKRIRNISSRLRAELDGLAQVLPPNPR